VRDTSMTRFTAHTTTSAAPEHILEVLTDPDAIRSWSPIPFEVEELEGIRLQAGSLAHVSGSLAGKRVGFDVQVRAADQHGLELTAEGPISIDVLYELEPVDGGSEMTASVSLRDGPGLTGRILAAATGALLRGGALEAAARRITRTAESSRLALA
jgi:Polyketide cyclase / dehydrase and lipid transport